MHAAQIISELARKSDEQQGRFPTVSEGVSTELSQRLARIDAADQAARALRWQQLPPVQKRWIGHLHVIAESVLPTCEDSHRAQEVIFLTSLKRAIQDSPDRVVESINQLIANAIRNEKNDDVYHEILAAAKG